MMRFLKPKVFGVFILSLTASVVAVAAPNTGEVKVGEVKVLFVSVSVVAFPISVSVATGRVSVPEPAADGACSVILPETSPATEIELILFS
jgi:hypothetical protein